MVWEGGGRAFDSDDIRRQYAREFDRLQPKVIYTTTAEQERSIMGSFLKWLIVFIMCLAMVGCIHSCATSEAPSTDYERFKTAYTYKESRPRLDKMMEDGKLSVFEAGTIKGVYDETLKAREDKAEEAARQVARDSARAFMAARKK